MPVLVLLALVLVLPIAVVLLTPVALVQRYRMGTARRRARGWLATLNAALLALSALLFLAGAAVTTVWAPGALTHAAGGLLGGAVLGIIGLRLSRWEASAAGLHYTPNRWLVLGVTLVVAGRIGYGVWRGWEAWHVRAADASWLAASGAAGALAAGGLVIGYYLAYWFGLRRRAFRHATRTRPAGPPASPAGPPASVGAGRERRAPRGLG